MGTERTETVVDKAVAYVKDIADVPPGDRTPDVEAKPQYVYTMPEPTSEAAMRKGKAAGGARQNLSPAELHADGPMN